MQPETEIKEKTMTGEKVVVEPKSRKAYTPAEQWDHLAFSVIGNELVSKGFKEKKNGMYRGSKYVEVPKNSVVKSQKIAAQLVRGFRNKTQERLKAIIKDVDQWIIDDDAKLKACRFWEFRKKRDLWDRLVSLRGQGGAYRRLLQELENVGIK